MTNFSDLKLAEPLDKALNALGYETPTPIQAEAIPHLMEGRDLMGIAQTGTGKTAAFALPSLNHIFTEERDPPKRGSRVLVLAPTRELVGQIRDSFNDYGRFMNDLTVTHVTGGVSISQQIKKLVRGNDVIVATPGRLIDLLDRKAITLKEVEILILDEADQMMDMGFIHALKKIIPLLPKKRQTLFFSATMAPKIKKLADDFLTNPIRVAVTPANKTADKIKQSLVYATKAEKPMLLAVQLIKPEVEKALVFTRTKHGADRVVKRLGKDGLNAKAIHGNKTQGQRQRALDSFRNGEIDILVATDVAARGIDIPGITHVINYEIPNVPEQYVHRIGRTARANAEGHAIAFVAPDERPYLKDIQKLLKTTIPVDPQPSDLAAQIAVVKARPAIEITEKPYVEKRKGRGKSNKKKGGGQGGRGRFTKGGDSGRSDSGRSDSGRSDSGRSDSNRSNSGRSDSGRSDGNAPKRDARPDRNSRNDAARKTSGKPSGESRSDNRPKRAFEGENRERSRTTRPAPKRDDKPRSDKPRSDKPRSDKPKTDRKPGEGHAGAPSNFKRKTRKPAGRNSGGGQPPKRRG